jgi:hypothetical protein
VATDWTPENFNQFMIAEVARWTPPARKIDIRLD